MACRGGWTASGNSGHCEGSGQGEQRHDDAAENRRGRERASGGATTPVRALSIHASRNSYGSAMLATGHLAIWGNFVAVLPAGPTRIHTVVKVACSLRLAL